MATPIRPTINDTFQKMLSDLESVGLSEGDYLSMSNSLKKAFDTVERKEELQEIKHTYPINLEIALEGGFSMKYKIIVSSVEITYVNGARPNKYIAKVVVKNYETNEIVVGEKLYALSWTENTHGDSPLETFLARVFCLTEATDVAIVTREKMIIYYGMVNVLKHDKKKDGLQRIVWGVEDDDDDEDYLYNIRMFHRIMISKINQIIRVEALHLESFIPHEMRRF